MTRIQMICYCLLASAFVLGAMVVVKGTQLAGGEAYAGVAANKGSISEVTARIGVGEDMLYVLDGDHDMLLGYIANPNSRRLELVATQDIGRTIEMAVEEAHRQSSRDAGSSRGRTTR